jgi:hypothetical protein
MAKKKLSDKNLGKLITNALSIEDEAAKDAGALGFMARALTQATLPHSKKDGMEFVRVNGDFILTIIAPSKVGLPYGSIPRLLLSWAATEAVKTQSKTLVMGDSVTAFMSQLGLMPTGGRWGSITRLRDQSRRLFSSTVSYTYTGNPCHWADGGFRIASNTRLWWDKDPQRTQDIPEGVIELSQEFFNEIVTSPVPVDMRALMTLKQSPMALDIYTWLTYRMSYLAKSTIIPWEALEMQFGADYKVTRQFKAAFIGHLRAVCTVYPEARVEATDQGLKLNPSPPHVARLQKTG